MIDAKTRALRRFHYRRVQKRRADYWSGHAGASPRTAGQVVAAPCRCSCFLCGNQRQHHGATVAELRARAE